MSARLVIDVEYLPAEGDDPAGYLATCEEIGLSLDGDDIDHLIERLALVLPELVEENRKAGSPLPDQISFELRHELDGDRLLQGVA